VEGESMIPKQPRNQGRQATTAVRSLMRTGDAPEAGRIGELCSSLPYRQTLLTGSFFFLFERKVERVYS
jgi:hypothetical protein